jgi:hypothetical protein
MEFKMKAGLHDDSWARVEKDVSERIAQAA